MYFLDKQCLQNCNFLTYLIGTDRSRKELATQHQSKRTLSTVITWYIEYTTCQYMYEILLYSILYNLRVEMYNWNSKKKLDIEEI